MKIFFLFFAFFPAGTTVLAMPIATEVALPVARDQGILRIKSTVNSKAQTTTNLLALGYGLHADTTLIATLPYMHAAGGSGLGDVPILLRQTIVKSDRRLRTLRFALLGGIEIPTWRDSISQRNVGLKTGSVFTLLSDRHELDADLIHTNRVTTAGFSKGNSLAYDLAYQIRFYPWRLAEEGVSSQWNLDIELNGTHQERDTIDGARQTGTGGQYLYLSSGIQWISESLALETLYQFPVLYRLNGNRALGHQFILGFRSLIF